MQWFLLLMMMMPQMLMANWFIDMAVKAAGFNEGDSCGFTRLDALECLRKYVDFNKDGRITGDEFHRAKLLYLPPLAAKLSWVVDHLGYGIELQQVLRDCNAAYLACRKEYVSFCLSKKSERATALEERLKRLDPGDHTMEEARYIAERALFNQTHHYKTLETCELHAKERCGSVIIPEQWMYFTPRDWIVSEKRCLPSKQELCQLHVICKRAAAIAQ